MLKRALAVAAILFAVWSAWVGFVEVESFRLAVRAHAAAVR